MEGKKVALVKIEGESSAKAIVEVALVNQILKRGTFILVPKNEVRKARDSHAIDPMDWKSIARSSGAEIALRARVQHFEAEEHEGYSAIEEFDSRLAAERGEAEGHTQRMIKVKSLTGKVAVMLEFTDLGNLETTSALAFSEDKVISEARNSAAHLPPRLRFLENLTNEAFRQFFEQYN